MNLVIVESPTKSKTLQGFLGKNYKVLASYGHVRDLPKGELGIDVEKDFEPKYVIPTKSRKILNALKKELKKTKSVILATDEDREGEAIAWHLAQALGLDKDKGYQRIVFLALVGITYLGSKSFSTSMPSSPLGKSLTCP